MWQVIVETKIGSLDVYQRHAVADGGVAEAKGLLDTEQRFKSANEAVKAAEGLKAVVVLDPVALRMLAAVELRAQAKAGVFRLPPHVGAEEVLMRALQQTAVGETGLQALVGQVEADASSGGALGGELSLPLRAEK